MLRNIENFILHLCNFKNLISTFNLSKK